MLIGGPSIVRFRRNRAVRPRSSQGQGSPQTDHPGTGRTAAVLRATRSASRSARYIQDHGGKLLRILSNDVDAPARRLPTLQAPLGDRAVFPLSSRPLKISLFLGTGGNAVRIQIAVNEPKR